VLSNALLALDQILKTNHSSVVKDRNEQTFNGVPARLSTRFTLVKACTAGMARSEAFRITQKMGGGPGKI
jgi:hypothetical protein